MGLPFCMSTPIVRRRSRNLAKPSRNGIRLPCWVRLSKAPLQPSPTLPASEFPCRTPSAQRRSRAVPCPARSASARSISPAAARPTLSLPAPTALWSGQRTAKPGKRSSSPTRPAPSEAPTRPSRPSPPRSRRHASRPPALISRRRGQIQFLSKCAASAASPFTGLPRRSATDISTHCSAGPPTWPRPTRTTGRAMRPPVIAPAGVPSRLPSYMPPAPRRSS